MRRAWRRWPPPAALSPTAMRPAGWRPWCGRWRAMCDKQGGRRKTEGGRTVRPTPDFRLPPPGVLPPAPLAVHLVGVGGIGVSGQARILLERGYRVSGCDLVPNRLTADLAALGATVCQGHDPAHLAGVDLLVISSAVRPQNPELVAAVAQGLPTIKSAELLAMLLDGLRTIAVAGTHGKTTTSALVAALLLDAGLDPTAFIGGEVPALGEG